VKGASSYPGLNRACSSSRAGDRVGEYGVGGAVGWSTG